MLKLRFLLPLTFLLGITSIFIGVGNVSLSGLLAGRPEDWLLFTQSRLPRLLSILIAGASLSVSWFDFTKFKPQPLCLAHHRRLRRFGKVRCLTRLNYVTRCHRLVANIFGNRHYLRRCFDFHGHFKHLKTP